MAFAVRIGLVGDYQSSVIAHQAIPRALALAAEAFPISVETEWLPTETIDHTSDLTRFDGLWSVPATPYRSMEGALLAIRFAREQSLPFLGTCGGFQHAILEFARDVLGWADADHAESAPDAVRPVITPLTCSLVEVSGQIHFVPGSLLAMAYGVPEVTEGYHCRYGLNPAFQSALLDSGALRIAATDTDGEVRAVELSGHPFYVAMLFQPERAALRGELPPIVAAFVRAASEHARYTRE